MGLDKKTSQGGRFLFVKHHSICEESKEPREGFEPIEVTNPRTNEVLTKYVNRFHSLSGTITKIEYYDTEKQYETRFVGLKIHLKDAGEHFTLDLPFKSRAYDSFTKMAENIDYHKPVEFSAWRNRKDNSTGFGITQEGVQIQWKYTREHMFDCPEAVKDELNEWDFKAQKVFLRNVMIKNIIPMVDALNTFDEPQESDEVRQGDAYEEPPPVDSVPWD